MKRLRMLATLTAMMILSFWSNIGLAAPADQTFNLQPGWNAIFLEVDPGWPDPTNPIPNKKPTDPDVVFANVPNLLSVWRWNPNTGMVMFIQDPSTLMPEMPDMLAYFPAASENAPLSNLYAIQGNTAYLIHLGGTANVNLTVTGEPQVPYIDWKPNSFNLVGFHQEAGQETTYTSFLSFSAAHADQEMYVLRNDVWTPVQVSDLMQQGEAFWIYCKGSSDYTGPVSVQLSSGQNLDYGTSVDEFELVIKNNTTGSRQVQLSPSSDGFPLYYWYFDTALNTPSWKEITSASPLAVTLGVDGYGKGKSQILRLGVKRAVLLPDETATTNLVINDPNGYGVTIQIPATVTGISYAGLWSGYAMVNKVEEVTQGDNLPVKTGSEFAMRILMHVDAENHASLLQQVIQMWQEGILLNDPDNFGAKIVDPEHPGHFVLLADDSLTPYFSGAALLDGRPVGRRLSSSSFGNFYELNSRPTESPFEPYTTFDRTSFKILIDAADQTLTQLGTFQLGSSLKTVLWLPLDDPSNPFVHKYHPDHLPPVKIVDPDAPPTTYKWSQSPEKRFDIIRNITFDFSETDDDGNPIFGSGDINWGSSKVGGVYRETLSGLHRDSISLSGTFILRKTSNVSSLTTTPPE